MDPFEVTSSWWCRHFFLVLCDKSKHGNHRIFTLSKRKDLHCVCCIVRVGTRRLQTGNGWMMHMYVVVRLCFGLFFGTVLRIRVSRSLGQTQTVPCLVRVVSKLQTLTVCICWNLQVLRTSPNFRWEILKPNLAFSPAARSHHSANMVRRFHLFCIRELNTSDHLVARALQCNVKRSADQT